MVLLQIPVSSHAYMHQPIERRRGSNGCEFDRPPAAAAAAADRVDFNIGRPTSWRRRCFVPGDWCDGQVECSMMRTEAIPSQVQPVANSSIRNSVTAILSRCSICLRRQVGGGIFQTSSACLSLRYSVIPTNASQKISVTVSIL